MFIFTTLTTCAPLPIKPSDGARRKSPVASKSSAKRPPRSWAASASAMPAPKSARPSDMNSLEPILIATRGSALALAQANLVLAQCRAAFPKLRFDLKILKTTGDKLQSATLAEEGKSLPNSLFTTELEVALLTHKANTRG